MTLKHRILAENRRGLLKAMLAEGRKIRAIECHNPLSGLIGSEATIDDESGGRKSFDALWLSGFTCASSRALPDVELARQEKKLETIEEIAAATDKPLIADADTGGDALAFRYLCTRLEALGVSLIIVEDKVFPKRTSLAAGVHHDLEDPQGFAAKIAAGKEAMLSDDVLVFARIESLIAGAGLDDALMRARTYLESAADGIVIHSKDKTGQEIFDFMDGFNDLRRETGIDKPLLCIPTAYNFVTDEELFERGASVVIHANHLLRAAFLAMERVCETILRADRSREADDACIDLPRLFALIGTGGK
jgi:phosphoenolpyruvate phosphomutase